MIFARYFLLVEIPEILLLSKNIWSAIERFIVLSIIRILVVILLSFVFLTVTSPPSQGIERSLSAWPSLHFHSVFIMGNIDSAEE